VFEIEDRTMEYVQNCGSYVILKPADNHLEEFLMPILEEEEPYGIPVEEKGGPPYLDKCLTDFVHFEFPKRDRLVGTVILCGYLDRLTPSPYLSEVGGHQGCNIVATAG
jgi:hypothetical protein